MIHANKVLMLIRREFWENRSLWITPLVISGVLLISAAPARMATEACISGPKSRPTPF
jgi:hypothetical protein